MGVVLGLGRFLTALFVWLALAAALSAGEELVGTSSANFLKIPVMARPAAMGEAYTALANDSASLSYNPAGPARTMRTQLTASHVIWFQDISLEHLGGVMPVGPDAALALGFTWLQVDSMVRTKRTGNGSDPLANYAEIGSFKPYDMALGANWAWRLTDRWNAGLGGRLIGQGIDKNQGYGVAFDAGVQRRAFFDWLDLGLAVQNMGSPISVGSTPFYQPLMVRGGLAARLMQRKLAIALDGVMAFDNSIVPELGAEWWIMQPVALRAGWRGGYASQPTAGMGIRLGFLELDYAWQPYVELGSTHRITASLVFGEPGAAVKATRPLLGPMGEAEWRKGGFVPQAARPDAVVGWRLKILSPSGSIEKSYAGTGIAPKVVPWDGRDSRGRVLPDGIFTAKLDVEYEGGLKASASGAPIELDSTPPVVLMDLTPMVVRPDSSGALLIPALMTIKAKDKHGIGGWKIEIRDPKGEVFRAFSGDGMPLNAVEWDGTDGKGKSFQTGSTALFVPFAKDALGNWGQGPGTALPVLLKEIHFDIASDALFEPGKADVRISAYNTLKSVKEKILEHYQAGTKVDIIGHTDNEPTVHSSYADNEALSEARARAVIKFLVTLLEMDEGMFNALGMGDRIPKTSNATAEGRAENRRVEVVVHAMEYR